MAGISFSALPVALKSARPAPAADTAIPRSAPVATDLRRVKPRSRVAGDRVAVIEPRTRDACWPRLCTALSAGLTFLTRGVIATSIGSVSWRSRALAAVIATRGRAVMLSSLADSLARVVRIVDSSSTAWTLVFLIGASAAFALAISACRTSGLISTVVSTACSLDLTCCISRLAISIAGLMDTVFSIRLMSSRSVSLKPRVSGFTRMAAVPRTAVAMCTPPC